MDLKVDYMIGEFLLNHAMSKLDEAYIHTEAQALKREALEKYAWLDEQKPRYIQDELYSVYGPKSDRAEVTDDLRSYHCRGCKLRIVKRVLCWKDSYPALI